MSTDDSQATLQDRIIEALRASDGPLSATQIAAAIDYDLWNNHLFTELWKMRRCGAIVRSGARKSYVYSPGQYTKPRLGRAPSTDQPIVEKHESPIIAGVTAAQSANVGNIWQFATEAQQIVFEKHARRQQQAITLPDEPVAIAFLSDLHIGSPGTDYEAIKADAELVRDTPGMYAGFHGDATDNWIVGKLTALQRGQAIGFDAERLLFESWVDMVAPKLLWFVQGNHDNWSEQLIGSAPNRDLIKGASMLWDRNQCIFDLHHCGHIRKVVIRHRWRFSSVYNPAHGMMVGWERGDIDFDIAVAGHTHIATLAYPFYKHNRIRHAILTGAYKVIDPFGEEIGFPAPKGRGCGALVFDTDGSQMFVDDLKTAALFLAWLRGQQ